MWHLLFHRLYAGGDANEGPGKVALGRAGEGPGDAAADAARAAMLAMRAWAHAASCCVAKPCVSTWTDQQIANKLIRLIQKSST